MSGNGPGSDEKPRTIGAINGGYQVLFRLMLASYPLVIAWGVWMSVEQVKDGQFRQAGDRWTQDQGMESRRRIESIEELQEGIENRLDTISIQLARIESRLNGTYKGPGP